MGALVIATTGEVRSVPHRHVDGADELPAASVARTSNRWEPSPRPENVAGEVQGSKRPPPRRHSNASSSSVRASTPRLAAPPPINVKVASEEFVIAGGPERITGDGGAR